MASIRIRVGAVLDSNATAVFAPLIAAAQRARKQIGTEGKKGAEEYVGGYRTAPAHARRAFDDVARAAMTADQKIKDSGQSAAKSRIQGWEQEERAISRMMSRQDALHRRMISSAGRSFAGAVRGGIGFAGEVARGAGVDFSVGSLVQRNVASRKTATDITNSGYVEGAAGNVGIRQDPAKVLEAAKVAADAAALSEEKALTGMQKFVGKSTDLKTGMDIVKDMAMLAKAGAGDLDDYMDAAGDVALKLGDIPNKGEAVVAVMKTMARQGQLGASEMRSFAKNVAPLIASAGMFAGGPAKAMNELGAAFQVTKQFGGAKSPAAAAVSVQNFVSDLKSQSGLKALHASGLKDTEIFADKGKTQMRALSEILPRMLELTKGDLTKVAAEMRGKQSGRVLTGFQKIFADAGGGAAGKAAVGAKFQEFGGAMSDKQIQESLARAFDTTEAKAQLFQNRLQAIADENLPKVMSAMEQLAPVAASAAEGLAKFAGFAAENPGKAVALALSASIAKAGLEAALTAGLAKAFAGMGGLTIGAASIAVALGTIALTAAAASKAEGAAKVTGRVATGEGILAGATEEYKRTGGLSPETMKALQDERARVEAEQGKAGGKTSWVDALAAFTMASTPGKGVDAFKGKWADIGEEQAARGQSGGLASEKKGIDAMLDAAAKHMSVAEAFGPVITGLHAAADRLGASPGGAAPGATTGPVPLRGH